MKKLIIVLLTTICLISNIAYADNKQIDKAVKHNDRNETSGAIWRSNGVYNTSSLERRGSNTSSPRLVSS